MPRTKINKKAEPNCVNNKKMFAALVLSSLIIKNSEISAISQPANATIPLYDMKRDKPKNNNNSKIRLLNKNVAEIANAIAGKEIL